MPKLSDGSRAVVAAEVSRWNGESAPPLLGLREVVSVDCVGTGTAQS